MEGKFWTGFNRVCGKPHRKMPQRAVLLKGFRIRCEVSRNLMICAHSWIASLTEKQAANWSHCWPLFTNPFHLDVKPPNRTSDSKTKSSPRSECELVNNGDVGAIVWN
jgi:hypothetical protein